MSTNYIEDKTFNGINFTTEKLPNGDYDNCKFTDCILYSTDLSGLNFSDCEFINCDLSSAKIDGTAFQEVHFQGCKLLGLHFENCNEFLFAVYFSDCILNLSSFYQRRLKKMKFINCSLQEVDFTETDLWGSLFDNCDLNGAVFEKSLLEKADFRTSFNYSIDPDNNGIKKARFSKEGVIGLLDKYNIIIE